MTSSRLVIHVLGPFMVTDQHRNTIHLSSAVGHVMALLVAGGTHGLTKEAIAEELWGTSYPSSWKSAIRNRITRARSALGPEAVVNVSNRYQLAETVDLDSMGLADEISQAVAERPLGLGWLEGSPLEGIAASPLVETYRRDITSARSVRVRELVNSAGPALSPRLLDALRRYQFGQAHDAAITEDVVRAHIHAGDFVSARQILNRSRDLVTPKDSPAVLVDVLAQTLSLVGDDDRTVHPSRTDLPARAPMGETRPRVANRADLFWSAAADQKWTMAYEIAMEGSAQTATISGGDRDRWPLLMAIPLEQLDRARQVRLATSLAWHMRVADPEQALVWSETARELVTSQDEAFLADVADALVGNVADERALLALPVGLGDPSVIPGDMHSYQVVVANHLERSAWADVAPIIRRFHELVGASPDPHRRWHGMNLQVMQSFIDGDWEVMRRQAKQACDYGGFYRLAEADLGWNCHLLLQEWALDRTAPAALHFRFLEEEQALIGKGLTSLASGDTAVVERYLEGFDFESRRTFAVPMMVALATKTESAELRAALYERLVGRSGTAAIFGIGLMHLGPVDRICARLTDSPAQQRLHLESAIQVADDQQTRIWQLICRRELAALTDEQWLMDEVLDLATTPILRELAGTGGAKN